MQHFSNKAGWVALGIVVGVGTSLLLGANQPTAEKNDRYDVDIHVTAAGTVLLAHDREDSRLLIYQVAREDDATLKGMIDLAGLGGETLPLTLVDMEDNEDSAE